MIIHPQFQDMTLFEIRDLDEPTPRSHPTVDSARAVLQWARTYLSAPHPDLGRPGPVCPFVPSSLRNSLFYVSVRRGCPDDVHAVADEVMRYRDWFLDLEPRTGRDAQLKTILVLFPDVEPARMPELIDTTQSRLKPAFVASGLMIGQFHPTPPVEGGLWNADFRPLRSPVPLLAIRQMVTSDLPFLTSDRELIRAYLRHFGDAVPARCQDRLLAAAESFDLELKKVS